MSLDFWSGQRAVISLCSESPVGPSSSLRDLLFELLQLPVYFSPSLDPHLVRSSSEYHLEQHWLLDSQLASRVTTVQRLAGSWANMGSLGGCPAPMFPGTTGSFADPPGDPLLTVVIAINAASISRDPRPH